MSDNTCKTCQHWKKHEPNAFDSRTYGECLVISCGVGGDTGQDGVASRYDDDYEDNLRTGPDFGCIRHKAKDS